MPVVPNQDWIRTVEPLYKAPGSEWTGPQLYGYVAGTTTKASFLAAIGTVQPGHVYDVTSGGVKKATSGTNLGRFFGLMHSEVSADYDECIGKGVAPTLLRYPCTAKVYAAALNADATYVLDGTANNEELIAVAGKLTPRGDNTTAHTVGRLVEVESSGAWIVIELAPPPSSVT